MGDVNELQKKGTKTMANLPGSIKNLNTLLGEQLLEGGGSGGGGSSDFSTAEVIVVKNYENAFTIHTPIAMDNDEMPASLPDIDSSNIGNRTIFRVILYKGNAVMLIDGFSLGAEPTITTSGNIQYIEIAHIYTITGDCTITIS